MRFFKHIITAAVIIGTLSVGALADDQKKGQRPPKEPRSVDKQEKQRPQPPPPRNDNRGNDQGRDRGDRDNRRGRP